MGSTLNMNFVHLYVLVPEIIKEYEDWEVTWRLFCFYKTKNIWTLPLQKKKVGKHYEFCKCWFLSLSESRVSWSFLVKTFDFKPNVEV